MSTSAQELHSDPQQAAEEFVGSCLISSRCVMSLLRVRRDEFHIISNEDEPAGEGNDLVVQIGVNDFDVPAGGVVVPFFEKDFNGEFLRLLGPAARKQNRSERTTSIGFVLELNEFRKISRLCWEKLERHSGNYEEYVVGKYSENFPLLC